MNKFSFFIRKCKNKYCINTVHSDDIPNKKFFCEDCRKELFEEMKKKANKNEKIINIKDL